MTAPSQAAASRALAARLDAKRRRRARRDVNARHAMLARARYGR